MDARVGNALIEVKFGVDALRTVRTSLMQVAYAVGEDPALQGYVILADSGITMERLRDEWERAATVLREDVLRRLTVCVPQEGRIVGIPLDPDPGMQQTLAEVVAAEREGIHRQRGSRASEPYYDILRVLVRQWMLRAGPVTSRWLAETAGCTYPTVASALTRLEKYLTRHTDRRVELGAFPRDEWFRLVANADRVRQTRRYADRSGQPRSAESLLLRLRRLNRADVAVGGVAGARHHFPHFDLVGVPRLDLTIHCRRREPDLGFLRKLDPALQPARPDEVPRLVLHVLRRPVVFFDKDPDTGIWADPVECLLDLHEMRLEAQAAEFLANFTPK